jgi:hypothetical protein
MDSVSPNVGMERHLCSIGHPSSPKVLKPRRQFDWRVRKSVSTALCQQAVERCWILPPASGVTHHDLEKYGPIGPGLEGAEGGSLRKLNVGADRASSVGAEDLPLEDHDDVWAEMTVSPLE